MFIATAEHGTWHGAAGALLGAGAPDGEALAFAPLSATLACVLNLTVQYVLVFAALGACRTILDLFGTPHKQSLVHAALKQAAETMFCVPMACVLFVGFRLRVLQLTGGKGEAQVWAQWAMWGVANATTASTLLVLFVPLLTAKELQVDPHSGDPVAANPFRNPVLACLFTALRYGCGLVLYFGIGVVVVAVYTFGADSDAPVAPAVACTCLLAGAFFTIYVLQALVRTWAQWTHRDTQGCEHVLRRGADTLALAPMLGVLFLCCRLRALQLDPSGNPQAWAQNCFYASSCGLLAQTALALVVPAALGGTVASRPELPGDVAFEVPNKAAATVLTAARQICMLLVYVGSIAVVCSVFTMEHPQGGPTPPLSPSMHCCLNLVFQYFFLFFLLWVFITIEDLSGRTAEQLRAVKEALDSAKATVQFAPMLCVLFLAARMRALQLTENRGAPQQYVQSAMYCASWAVLVQFFLCLLMPLITGRAYPSDSLAGCESPKEAKAPPPPAPPPGCGGLLLATVRYGALLALVGGAAAVVIGVLLMTPEACAPAPYLALPPPSARDLPLVKDGMQQAGKAIGQSVNAGVDAVTAIAMEVPEQWPLRR